MLPAFADEHRTIVNWAKYHQHLGVGKIYIVDMGLSMAPLLEEAGLIQSGFVKHIQANLTAIREDLIRTVNRTIPREFGQIMAYEMCLRDYRKKHRWIAFIDTDEYLTVIEKNSTLKSILSDYEDYGALGVHWRTYGAEALFVIPSPVGGRMGRPEQPPQEAYHACYPMDAGENRHVKSVMNMQYAEKFESVHHASYYEGRFTVNTGLERIPRFLAEKAYFERVALRHYLSKSLWDYQEKMKRGSGMSRRKDMAYFYRVQKEGWQDCRNPAAWPVQ